MQTLALPADTTAWTLTLRTTAGHHLQLAALTGPDGPVVPADWIDVGGQPWLYRAGPERVRAEPWSAAFLVPNAPGVGVSPGTWQWQAYAFDYDPLTDARAPTATTIDATVTAIRRPTAGLHVNVNLCLTGARGITADTAPAHPRVQAALDVVRETWLAAGVTIDTVRYVDVPAGVLSVTHDNGEDLELRALFALAADQPDGIPIFLLESVFLETASGTVAAAGITGGIPAPAGMGGPRTGIALALQFDAPDLLGVAMAHELGHFLGLFHTVEASSTAQTPVLDALPDTPAQPGANIMDFAPQPGVTALTPQQARVIAGSVWLQP